ncbi:zinc finger protein 385D isoform X1 [Osmerus eperlanus]|uniref:zinc finger protein 385D isoform X1 n=3 Tax=Osmerus eperlanus TaxID=29151 RepID=UPI002E15C353
MESNMFFGNACQNGLLPALVRPTLPTLQPSLGMKHFLPFPLDTASAVRLFPSFSAMDPIQKAVMPHAFGVLPSAKRKHVSCSVCQLRFNSQSQALAHYKGTKHAKKLKTLDAPKCKLKGLMVTKETTNLETSRNINTSAVSNCTDMKDKNPEVAHLPLSPVLKLTPPLTLTLAPLATELTPVPLTTTRTETTSAMLEDERQPSKPASPLEVDEEAEAEAEPETEEEKAKRLLYCSLCKVAVNSASQLEAHNSGTKHKTMLEARNGMGSIKSFPRPGIKSKMTMPTKAATGLQNKTFHCETCDVHVNSETQLKQHISSRRHKDRAAGKPAKPKYSPYIKPAKDLTKQPVKLTVGKEVCQPMTTAQILPSHLAAMAAAMGSAFSLRTTHTPNHAPTPTLFQTQTLSAALLRPAPGPVRTSHPQILFAPY